ncbi:MAG: O-methyltransferase [Planctomycetes bacterium]|nr:O-methyltransferase [Planctomycetota bacterium]
MSKYGVTLTPEHFAYIRARTTAEDEFLVALARAADAEGIPAISVTPEQGALLQILLRAGGAREVVEVGTLAGCSAIWMARALPALGRVRTIEIEPRHANFAESWIARSDVAGRIEVHRGDARDVLPGFADGSADLVFLDADKTGYAGYLEHAVRIVRRGGLVVVDNALAFGHLLDDEEQDESVVAVRRFNERLAGDARLQSVLVPLGDGMWVGVRR